MDISTVIIIVVVIALVMLFLNRNRGAARGPFYNGTTSRGNERPTYDDPNYTSGGSIGGAPEPDSLQERSVGGAAPSNSPHHDDPNYRSGGSIGG
jgi:hypothetical protein